MSELLIRGGRVLAPGDGLDGVLDIRVSGGRIVEIAPGLALGPGGEVVDTTGCIVAPGFVDLHAHLREPGFEHKGTIATETRAALRGGFTTICAMPNTDPAPDSAAVLEALKERIVRDAVVRVLPIGCVTKGRAGNALAELSELMAGGCVALSDDGNPVADARLMRHALQLLAGSAVPLSEHSDDPVLNGGGSMNEGRVSERLGLPGQPAAAEITAVARNVALAEETGARLHLAHVTTARSVELVAEAKARGVPVTCEVTPSHLFLTEDAVFGPGPAPAYDTNAKINPPLRTEADRRALIRGLMDGTIDAIATDHAPHAIQDKECEFDLAAPGISCFETALGTLLLQVERGEMALPRVIEALTTGPATCFPRLPAGAGHLQIGGPADIVVFDPAARRLVEPRSFASKGRNTPLAGMELPGVVRAVIVGGALHRLEEAVHG